MFIIQSYPLAILFCFITMLCWGSWANTQKLTVGKWPFELFYWDYVLGILVLTLVAALTMGSFGSAGRPFLVDLQQVSSANLLSAFTGGAIFNLANIMLTAAIAIAGMSVAFPVGIGLALIIGVLVNYNGSESGDPLLLFTGVGMVATAIVLNAIAYGKKTAIAQKPATRGIILSVIAGLLMSFFYKFIAVSMDLENFEQPAAQKMTPYTASFVFAVGIVLSNLVFNTYLMKKPITGTPVSYRNYFEGRLSLHMIGLAGGIIWAIGNLFNLIAAGKAGAAISYGLGQGATLIAAIWGVYIWKEFKGAPKSTNKLLLSMFILFVVGLGLIIAAGK